MDEYLPVVFITCAIGHRDIDPCDDPACGPGILHLKWLAAQLHERGLGCISRKGRKGRHSNHPHPHPPAT